MVEAAVRPRIMVVDDNRDFLQTMESILQEMTDYQVICVDNGKSVQQVAQAEKPDVIMLDVYMPGMNGPQVCSRLKSSPQLRNIPVLFLTAVGSDPHFRARCLEMGGDDFLEKPVNTEELVARLRVLLRIKSLQDELRRERDELELKVQERARELKRTETLAAIGKMVAGVAHEIRNPLGAISNSAAVLSRDLVLEGEDLKLMEIIVKESAKLRETINEFLTFAHPPPFYFTPLNLSNVIEDVLLLIKRDSLCGPEVNVSLDVPKEISEVEIDRDRMQQVFWNLIRNALEAIKGQGRIEIKVSSEVCDDQSGVSISVADDGPGIPPEDREQIFDPFFTRKARGSGLGLALVHSTLKAHGGKITLQEGRTKGCEFKIWIPLKQSA